MQLTHFEERQKLAALGERLMNLAKDRADTGSAASMSSEIEELQSGRFLLAVIGKVKRGKSTFCNAFLGRQNDKLAPVDKLPASSVISKFIWNATEQVNVHYREGRHETTGYERIVDFVTEERNPENREGVSHLEIRGPFDGLERDLILVDTPGSGSIHKHHDVLLHDFLPQADAVIFLVTARMPIAADELELLKALKTHEIRKIFFAINQIDLVDDGRLSAAELDEAVEHNLAILRDAGLDVDKIHRISARRAMLGNVADSGILPLLREISDYLMAHKAAILHSKFLNAARQIADALQREVTIELDSAKRSEDEIRSDVARLHEDRRAIDKQRQGPEDQFKYEWDAALERFEFGLTEAEEAAKRRLHERIDDRFPLVGGKGFIKELPTLIARTVEEELAGTADAFERATRTATEKLQLNYPHFEVGNAGYAVVRVGGQSVAVMKGLATGAIATAAGIGTIGAAATATATAAVTTVAAPSLVASIGTWIGGWLGGVLTTAGTGTTTIAATLPAWVALAGPVGWTLIGIGALVVPFSYGLSRGRLKEDTLDAAQEQLRKMFAFMRRERVAQLRKLGKRIVEEFRLKLDNDLLQVDTALQRALERKTSSRGLEDIEQSARALEQAAGEINRYSAQMRV